VSLEGLGSKKKIEKIYRIKKESALATENES